MKPGTRILIDRFGLDREKWPKSAYPKVRDLHALLLRSQRQQVGRRVAAWIIDSELRRELLKAG